MSWNIQDKPPTQRVLRVKLGGLVGKALASDMGGCGFRSGGGEGEGEEGGGGRSV